MKTIVIGTAMEVNADHPDAAYVRIYRADGRAFMGTETHTLSHACDSACAQSIVEEMGGFVSCTDSTTALVCTEANVNGEYATVDVQSFDAGDDTYVLCDACKEVLHADGPAHLAMFGTLLPGYVPADDEEN